MVVKKFTKEMTSKLIKYVTKVDVTFNPMDIRTKSARELLRQLDCNRFQVANSKMKVNSKLLYNPNPPSVSIGFVDGTDLKFDSQKYKANDMIFEIFQKALSINFEYEINRKSIDD